MRKNNQDMAAEQVICFIYKFFSLMNLYIKNNYVYMLYYYYYYSQKSYSSWP